jgi:hypothetical protein
VESILNTTRPQSADNLQFVTAAALGEAWRLMRVASILDEDRVFLNLSPEGAPLLGPRGLFADVGTARTILDPQFFGRPLQFCSTLPPIMPFWNLREGARRLEECGLLTVANDNVIE